MKSEDKDSVRNIINAGSHQRLGSHRVAVLKVCPRTSTLSITWELVRDANSLDSPQPY